MGKPTFYQGKPYFGPSGKPAFGTLCCAYEGHCFWVELSSSISGSGTPSSSLNPPLPDDGRGKIIFKGEALDTFTTPHGYGYYTLFWVISTCLIERAEILGYQLKLDDFIQNNGWVEGEGSEGLVECNEFAILTLAGEYLVTPAHNNPTPDEVNIIVGTLKPEVCCP